MLDLKDKIHFEFVKLYTVKFHWPIGYNIIFDETSILCWWLCKEDAEKFCNMLNGAYNLGRSAGFFEKEFGE